MSENSAGAVAVVGESGAENVSTKQAKLRAFLMAFDRYRKAPRLGIESVCVAFDAYMGAPDDPPSAPPSKGPPSGPAWERLVEACKAYCAPRKVPSWSPLGAEIQKAYAAYEAAQSAEPKFGECETCGVGQHLPSGSCDHCGTKKQGDDLQRDQQATIEQLTKERDSLKQRLYRTIKAAAAATWDDDPKKLEQVLGLTDDIERLTKERDEALAELRSLSTISGQTIAELRTKLERPEMPECVSLFLFMFDDLVKHRTLSTSDQKTLTDLAKAVRDHYAKPFIFDGTLGMYRVRYESGHTGEVEVIRSSSGLEFIDSDRDRRTLNADGTFDGGKLTKFLRPLEG